LDAGRPAEPEIETRASEPDVIGNRASGALRVPSLERFQDLAVPSE
jgi:hypothetical protein